MSITFEAEVEEYEVVGHLVRHPDMILEALEELAASKRKDAKLYAAGLRAMGGAEVPEDPPEAAEWAEAFRQMDALSQSAALAELVRANPFSAPLEDLRKGVMP